MLGYVDVVRHNKYSMIDSHNFSHTTIGCIASRESNVRPVSPLELLKVALSINAKEQLTKSTSCTLEV